MRRQPGYFGEGTDAFFGWRHADEGAPRACRVAVICGPIGHEYTRAHRSLRHLADRLARAGIPALRFDYHGIGDSPGSDLDDDRVATWMENIRTAIAQARAWSGCGAVSLIGVRLGASLAAMVAREVEVSELVLWNPVVKGRGYVRELQAIAMSAERAAGDPDGMLESAGSIMTAQTQEELRAVDLLAAPPKAARVLVAVRDDQNDDTVLADFLTSSGVRNERVRLPGWAGMMAEHQYTVVPDRALEAIVEWIAKEPPADSTVAQAAAGGLRKSIDMGVQGERGMASVEETLCTFGDDDHLFGVLSRSTSAVDRPAVLLFNAGAVHRPGPNRVNATLARHLAASGIPVLRFDVEGIGDSVLRGEGRENHPYAAGAVDDARAAIEHLRREHGYTRFVAMGLCSGAHNTFHSGLQLGTESLCELVLINPLTFYWKEGMSLETTRHFEDAVQYRKSMRDPGRWMKLLRGDVDLKRLAETMVAQLKTKVRAHQGAVREIFRPEAAPRLARDLARILAMHLPVTLFVAEGDPGRDILMAGARRTAIRAVKSGAIRIETIPGADHTFSRAGPRKDLVARVCAHLRRHLPAAEDTRPGSDLNFQLAKIEV